MNATEVRDSCWIPEPGMAKEILAFFENNPDRSDCIASFQDDPLHRVILTRADIPKLHRQANGQTAYSQGYYTLEGNKWYRHISKE